MTFLRHLNYGSDLVDSTKPKDIEEYRKWLYNKHGVDSIDALKSYYHTVTSKMKVDFELSEFWTSLPEYLMEADSIYLMKTKYPLITGQAVPKLYVKSFESFFLKTYRKNILTNSHWPNPPQEGWMLPDNWFERVNDILRTIVVVKYFDGVKFLCDQVCGLCQKVPLTSHIDFEAKEEGYYAAHLYIKPEFEIPAVNWDTRKIKVYIEIQITTQLQEVIRQLLHTYYEDRRVNSQNNSNKWQWDYKSDEFVANYLGHILHYVEGMIMEIRDKQGGIL